MNNYPADDSLPESIGTGSSANPRIRPKRAIFSTSHLKHNLIKSDIPISDSNTQRLRNRANIPNITPVTRSSNILPSESSSRPRRNTASSGAVSTAEESSMPISISTISSNRLMTTNISQTESISHHLVSSELRGQLASRSYSSGGTFTDKSLSATNYRSDCYTSNPYYLYTLSGNFDQEFDGLIPQLIENAASFTQQSQNRITMLDSKKDELFFSKAESCYILGIQSLELFFKNMKDIRKRPT
ncbi:hypothetical protein sscle_14g102240 [Sclerotinia sclerotiorum 1980 UF-70]|uniref:Uncharacterized protein n=1 Tax=Sclerotinia sclerotiorum (strain ATCC 18683 / 1980 / Ss-1) TaxID=665079 RepID=A0A1D9QKI5_SCLS1|nr:hypothetical protein sscle_14g102240 [Sclerotinia sclerotiorum 1980 UF-70]